MLFQRFGYLIDAKQGIRGIAFLLHHKSIEFRSIFFYDIVAGQSLIPGKPWVSLEQNEKRLQKFENLFNLSLPCCIKLLRHSNLYPESAIYPDRKEVIGTEFIS